MQKNKLIFNLTTKELELLIGKAVKNVMKIMPVERKKECVTNHIHSQALLTLKEVVGLFKITKPTAYKWMKCGVLPKSLKVGGRVYFYKSEILKIIDNE